LTTTPATQPEPDRSAKGRGLWGEAWRRFSRSRTAMACLFVVTVYVVVALLVQLEYLAANWSDTMGPRYAPPGLSYEVIHTEAGQEHYGVNLERTDGTLRYELVRDGEPSGRHREIEAEKVERIETRTAWFGTDLFGRSILRKAIYGVRISLSVALFASLIAIAIGAPLGAIAGYFGKRMDEFIVWLYTTLASIPGLLLILAFAFVLRDAELFGYSLRGLPAVFLALGLTSWVDLCRLIRGEVIKHRERDYVTAARAYGSSNSRIIFRHILPNVTHLILIDFSIRVVQFIQAEVILSFLGLGPTDQPSWGVMIDNARQDLSRGVWWELAAATVFVFGLALALNIAGDALRDALDPKLKQ